MAQLVAALVLKMDKVEDAKQHTKIIDAKAITREALLKLHPQ